MKEVVTKTVKVALLSILCLILVGCSTKTDQSSRTYDENWRFVPRIHVEENSFGVTSGSEYWGCSYDMRHEGYWCPKER